MNPIDLEVLLTQPSESLVRLLLDAAPVASGIAVDARLTHVNDLCTGMWGYPSAKAMLGMSIFDLIAPESQAEVIELWRRHREGPEPWTYELAGLRADGSTFPYRCTSVSLESTRGKATFAFFEAL
jgi:PAS domain S-box-containing protein